MKNIVTQKMTVADDAVLLMLNKARNEQRKDDALLASVRLEKMAIHAQQNGLSAVEIIELIRQDAASFENAAQELH